MTGDDLYNAALKRLAATPIRPLPAPDATATLFNPLCGDRVTIEVRLSDGRIAALGGTVKGCLLCQAAAAALAELSAGRTPAEARELGPQAAAILAGAVPPPPVLEPFLPVRPFRRRHACVLLPFEALAEAMGAHSLENES